MTSSIIDTPSFTEAPRTMIRPGFGRVDHDIEEIAIGFGQSAAPRSAFNVMRDGRNIRSSNIGQVTYRRVDPLHEPLKVADARLQRHLEDLCESLRAKY